MTKEEALGKWCPAARMTVQFHQFDDKITLPSNSFNISKILHKDGSVEEKRVNCVADACAMWVWTYTPEEAKGNENGPLGKCGLVYIL